MNVTVLGKYSPFPPAKGAGVGYWVESESEGVLLDCGPGVLSKFQEYVGSLAKIRTVVLSHLHFDHMADVTVLRYAASPDGRYRRLPSKITVYAPPEPALEYGLLNYKEVMAGIPVSHGHAFAAGKLKFTFYEVSHTIPAFAVRVEGPVGTVVYSGDTGPCQNLLKAAKGADLFFCEASATEEDKDFAASKHLTARQAGEIAAGAGVKRLILTHLWPFYDETVLLEQARAAFPNSCMAEEGVTYRV